MNKFVSYRIGIINDSCSGYNDTNKGRIKCLKKKKQIAQAYKLGKDETETENTAKEKENVVGIKQFSVNWPQQTVRYGFGLGFFSFFRLLF